MTNFKCIHFESEISIVDAEYEIFFHELEHAEAHLCLIAPKWPTYNDLEVISEHTYLICIKLSLKVTRDVTYVYQMGRLQV